MCSTPVKGVLLTPWNRCRPRGDVFRACTHILSKPVHVSPGLQMQTGRRFTVCQLAWVCGFTENSWSWRRCLDPTLDIYK